MKEGILTHETPILAIKGLGDPKKWKRFKAPYDGSSWSNSGSHPDALTFIP